MKRLVSLMVLFVFVAFGTANAQTYQNNYQADYPHFDNAGNVQWVSNKTFTKIDNGSGEYFLFAEGVKMDYQGFGLSAVRFDADFNVIQNHLVMLGSYPIDSIVPTDVKWLPSDEFIACGYIIETNGNHLAFVGHFDAGAMPNWIHTYPDIEKLNSIQPVMYQNQRTKYMACGIQHGAKQEAVVVGFDANGIATWKNYHYESSTTASEYTDLVEIYQSGSPTGKFGVVGYAENYIQNVTGMLISIVDYTGGSQDNYYEDITTGAKYWEKAYGIFQFTDAKLVVTGHSRVDNGWDEAIAVVLDLSLIPHASMRYNPGFNVGGFEQIAEETVEFDNYLYIGGHFNKGSIGAADAFIMQVKDDLQPVELRTFDYRDENRAFNMEVNHNQDGVVACGFAADLNGGGHEKPPVDPPYIIESYRQFNQLCLDDKLQLPADPIDLKEMSVKVKVTSVSTNTGRGYDKMTDVRRWLPCPKVQVSPIRKANTEIELSEEASVAVYPSPAKDFIVIEGCDSEYDFSIYSVAGALCAQGTLTATNENTVDISALSPGVYVIRMQSNAATQTIRFVKE